ncbi:MAG: ABC transporter permease subunit [Desulfobacter sp.]|nr:MAG: ABC transporter permease subunit [Desulfobacter sp.]
MDRTIPQGRLRVIDLYGYGGALAAGTAGTIKIMMMSLAVGLVSGMAGAGAKLSGVRLLAWFTDAWTIVIRGVPELILVLFVYFGGSTLISGLAGLMGYEVYVDINPLAAAVFTLGLVYGAYATDVFRVSILAVAKGELEAARAIGMGRAKVFFRILFPQIWRYALPGLGNLFMILQKDTALVSVIGMNELMRNAAQAVANTRKPFTFYITAALIYLGITTITTVVLHFLEQRANRGVATVS